MPQPRLIHYDPDADALYVDLERREDRDVYRTVEIDSTRLVDYDGAGHVLGVEFLWASDGLDLSGIPEAEAIRRPVQAFTALSAA